MSHIRRTHYRADKSAENDYRLWQCCEITCKHIAIAEVPLQLSMKAFIRQVGMECKLNGTYYAI